MAKNYQIERPKKGPEVRFDENKKMAIVSGTEKQVLAVYTALLSKKYPDKSPAVIANDIEMARGGIKEDFSNAYQYTFGVALRVRIFTDRFGDYAKRNKVVLLLSPNSSADEQEEQESLRRIKEEMDAIGYKL